MSRDRRIRIAMVVCAVIVICAVIAASAGIFSASGIGGYADADKYTVAAVERSASARHPAISVLKQLARNKRCYFASYTLYFPERAV